MPSTTCPETSKSNVQAIWACIEDVNGVLQKPTAADYIVPRGNASMNQVPDTANSEELSETLNVLDVFQNAVQAGEAKIPMYLRTVKNMGKMQGHAVFLAAMGDIQEGNVGKGTLSSAVTASGKTLSIAVTAGVFPPSGVVKIDSEQILYTSKSESSSTVTLGGCTRGYNSTTVAEHAASATVTLTSRVFKQHICRNTLSVWVKNDNLVTFCSGGVVTALEFGLSNEGGQTVDATIQFRQMGWAGRSVMKAASNGQTIQLATTEGEDASKAYTVGAFIKNTTKGDDNNGNGHKITAIAENGVITLGTTVNWSKDDQIDAWVPESAPIGEAVESRSVKVFVSGKAGKIREGTISISTPTEFLQEIGSEFPGENIDTKREIKVSMNGYLKADDARELGRGYNSYEQSVCVRFGRDAGYCLAVALPRVKMTMPEIGVNGAAFTLSREGSALGVNGEDALYLIQE